MASGCKGCITYTRPVIRLCVVSLRSLGKVDIYPKPLALGYSCWAYFPFNSKGAMAGHGSRGRLTFTREPVHPRSLGGAATAVPRYPLREEA